MSIDANRGFVCLTRHQPWSLYGVYADTTAGWYFLTFHASLPTAAYRDAEARRAVDAVFEDLGVDWPLTSPSRTA